MQQLGIASLTVGDAMTIDPVTIGTSDSIEHAEELMRVYRISGLPVVDDGGNLVGVISQTDLLWGGGHHVSVLLRKRPSGIRVGQLMTSPPLTIDVQSSIIEAARVMRDERVHRLVAIDSGSRPLGVISTSDIVALVADG